MQYLVIQTNKFLTIQSFKLQLQGKSLRQLLSGIILFQTRMYSKVQIMMQMTTQNNKRFKLVACTVPSYQYYQLLMGKEKKQEGDESFLEDDHEITSSSEDKSDDEKEDKDKKDSDSDSDDDENKSGGILMPIYELIKGIFPKVVKQPQGQE